MALRAKVLQKKAAKFELKRLQVLEVTKERVSGLEPILLDVYANRRPKPTDYHDRRELVRVFNEIAKEIYGYSSDIPVVVEFGSFVMDLFSTTSDLDLSVNFRTNGVAFPREKKIQTLRKFARKLYAIQSSGHVCGVLPITTAKVPILKCVDRGTGVECDISVENRDGILKSKIIHIISSIDDRFKKLSFLMKTWAKAYNINSSKDKTLNSLSIILLVAFHLQTRNPPILPPFAAILKDGTDPETVVKSLSNFVNYGQRNRESVAELFVTLLIKLSCVEKLWPKGLTASACSGLWTSKTWGDSKVACIGVEDFTDQSQNVARAVGHAEVKQIYKCIDISLRYIFSFMDGKIGVEVKDLLFGQDGVRCPVSRGIPNLPYFPSKGNHTRSIVTGKRKKRGMHGDFAHKQGVVQESCLSKKMRTGEGWRGVGDGRWVTVQVDDRVGNQHVNPTQQQKRVPGWDRIEQTNEASVGGGWGGTNQPRSSGWEISEQVRGWGGTQQPDGGGWRVTQQTDGGGWGVTQQTSGGGWGVTQQTNVGDRGVTQQTDGGGWGVTQQTGGGGWGVTQQTNGGGGWGVTQQTGGGGWGMTQQAGGGGLGMTQQTSGGGWGVTQQTSGGGWGVTQQSGGGGWGSWESGGRIPDRLRQADSYNRRF